MDLEEFPMDDEFTDSFVEPQESEPEPEPEQMKMPIIVADDEPEPPKAPRDRRRKTDKPYTVSAKVIERNRKVSKQNVERRKQEKQRLKEYEKLIQAKSLTRDEADKLLNEKLDAFEERITEKVSRTVQIPRIETIPEEPQGYTSDTQRRLSGRFKVHPTSPTGYDRFKRY